MHDDKDGERLAGWYHFGFTLLYVIAGIWHTRAALEHFRRRNETTNCDHDVSRP
jgi:hypothetical protein